MLVHYHCYRMSTMCIMFITINIIITIIIIINIITIIIINWLGGMRKRLGSHV